MNQEGVTEKPEEERDFSNMWLPCEFSDYEYWFLQQEEGNLSAISRKRNLWYLKALLFLLSFFEY